MKICFIGGGNMARALVGGLIRHGFGAKDLVIVEPDAAQRAALATLGVDAVPAPTPQCTNCDVIILAVKPQVLQAAVAPFAGKLTYQLVLSIAAGVRLSDLSRWLQGYQQLVRAMPNTPALVGAGMTGVYANPAVDDAQRAAVETILGALGRWEWVVQEEMLDAVTAVSGSGPAYVFYFMEALAAAAVAVGLDAAQADRLTLETFRGALALAASSDKPISVLRQEVTSPGGTTQAALDTFAEEVLATRIERGVRAAHRRAQELGALLGAR